MSITVNKEMIFFRFVRFLKPYWFQEAIIFILMILGTVSSLTFPYIIKIIIDDVFPNKDYRLLVLMISLFLGINILNIIISFISDYLYNWVSNHIVLDMRRDLFNHLLNLPLSFYQENKVGDIIHRINGDVSVIQSIISSSILRLVHSSLTIIGLAVALCWLNHQLFLLSIILLPFLALNVWYFQPKIRKVTERGQQKLSDILSFFMDRFENIKTIQAYNGYMYENRRLYSKISELIEINMKNVIYSSSMRSVSIFLMSLSPVLIFGWGGHQVMLGTMSLGGLVAFLQYLSRIFDPFKELSRLYADLVRASVSMRRILDFMNTPLQSQNEDNKVKVFSFKREIAFKDIDFEYNGYPVLEGFKLEIARGKKYALVGPSGCGKSTVVSLLCGFCEPKHGIISIDDMSLQGVDLFELRKKIGLVTQEHQLFRDTIWSNIQYGNFESTNEQIEKAARLSGVYNCINSRQSGLDLDLVVGDHHTNLSGGQKQRIAIARAILKNADLMILDEATSALDSNSEKTIIGNILETCNEKTIIIISHRISTIKNVDEIIYIDQGKVMEKGRHEELVEKKGYYWRTFQDQIDH